MVDILAVGRISLWANLAIVGTLRGGNNGKAQKLDSDGVSLSVMPGGLYSLCTSDNDDSHIASAGGQNPQTRSMMSSSPSHRG